MAFVTYVLPSTPLQWAVGAIIVLLTPLWYYLFNWILDPLSVRKFPGPPLAGITPYWLFWQRRHVRGFMAVHEAHKVQLRLVFSSRRNMGNSSGLPQTKLALMTQKRSRYGPKLPRLSYSKYMGMEMGSRSQSIRLVRPALIQIL